MPSFATRPADPAASYLEAFRTGASIAESNARLTQRAQEMDREFSMQQERLKRDAMVDDQRLQVQKAYHDQQLGLQRQKLQQAEQFNSAKMQQSAQRYTQQQQFRQQAQQIDAAVDGGQMTEEQGRQQKIRLMVNMAGPSSGTANALRAMAPKPPTPAYKPEFMDDPKSGARIVFNPHTGTPQIIRDQQPKGRGLSDYQKVMLLKNDRKALATKWADPALTAIARKTEKGESDYQADQQKLKALDEKIGGIVNETPGGGGGGSAGAGSEGEETFPAAPIDRSQRKQGQTYQTPKGPHTWTGSGWEEYASKDSNAPAADEEETDTPDDATEE